MIAITSCTSNSIQTPLPEQVEVIREKIKLIEQYTPPGFLGLCEEEVGIEAPTMEALAKTNIENHNRFKECFYMHNSWVEWYNDKQEDRVN